MALQTQSGFPLAGDGVNPAEVPQRTLYTGVKMPAIGLGTFGSDHASAALIAGAVLEPASVGYRHFDCASVYGNEAEIGASFQTLFKNGLRRDEIWVTSKLWNNKHAPQDVVESCRKSLKDLGLDYLIWILTWSTGPSRTTPLLKRM